MSSDPRHHLKGKRGDTALLLAHQEDHPKPVAQGGPGLMKDGACSKRCLVMTELVFHCNFNILCYILGVTAIREIKNCFSPERSKYTDLKKPVSDFGD